MIVEKINFNFKLLFDQHSSQGRKVMERLRDTYENVNPGSQKSKNQSRK